MKYLFFLWMFSSLSMMDTCNTVPTNQATQEEFSDLEYLVRAPKDLKRQAPVLILLHGYGSNEKDLFSFSNQIPDNWLVVLVRAPFSIGNNRYKWYNVEMVNEKITMNFEDEEKSRMAILKLIDQIVLKYKADKNKVVVAGFSQGANMSIGLALTEPTKVLAAGCFSGRFMEEIKPLIHQKERLKSKQVFISHGTADTMLPIRYAEENQEILKGFGIEITLSTDNVAHSISNKQLNEFVEWIKAL